MSAAGVRIVWIAGAVATGKSTAAWVLYRRLAAQGVRAAYVDIDQLGMCYPHPVDDPEGHLLKTHALTALLPGYQAHRAQVVIVSGVIDLVCGPRPALPSATDLTLVALTPDSDDLRKRILGRGCESRDAEGAVAVNDVLRTAAFVDMAIDTNGLSVSTTVERLLPTLRVPGGSERSDQPGPVRGSTAETAVVAVTGPRAAGSSTAGFGLASRRWRAGEPTAFVDPGQLSFVSGSASTDELAARQLAVMHEFTASRGAELFVVSGRPAVINTTTLKTVAPAAPHTIVRLRADRATLEDHVRQRALGHAARLAGDDLLGGDVTDQAHVVADAVAHQNLMDEFATENENVLEASGRSVDEVVDKLDRMAAEQTTPDGEVPQSG